MTSKKLVSISAAILFPALVLLVGPTCLPGMELKGGLLKAILIDLCLWLSILVDYLLLGVVLVSIFRFPDAGYPLDRLYEKVGYRALFALSFVFLVVCLVLADLPVITVLFGGSFVLVGITTKLLCSVLMFAPLFLVQIFHPGMKAAFERSRSK